MKKEIPPLRPRWSPGYPNSSFVVRRKSSSSCEKSPRTKKWPTCTCTCTCRCEWCAPRSRHTTRFRRSLNFGGLRHRPETDLEKNKTSTPEENFAWPRYTTIMVQKQKWPISDEFGLRSPVNQKQKNSQEMVYLYRYMCVGVVLLGA